MKLKFKQQPYQADATMAVIRCFEGQGKGIRKEIVGRDILDNGLFGSELTRVEEIFSNKKLEITDADILRNVQTIQFVRAGHNGKIKQDFKASASTVWFEHSACRK